MHTITHPVSKIQVSGMLLAAGATLRGDDLYDSTSGGWGRCPIPGLRLGETDTIWVRLGVELTKQAKDLLTLLNLHGGNFFATIGERGGCYYLLPSPSSNWDGRIEFSRISHPECIEELLDYGYLTRTTCLIRNPTSDYATRGGNNNVYVLSDLGKEELRKLIS